MPLAEDSTPFRWDLISPDQLGSLLAGTTAPDLWFLDDLVSCAGKSEEYVELLEDWGQQAGRAPAQVEAGIFHLATGR